ncbi:hypothetical protein GU926_14245 [Nibribacter ruber]|uniref:Uncharacterized protein n=1 Tax=Nibribacter ruber TaxID=2698458 RepID=A0A6P1P2C0_9BACT|nr:hypothetical protein [Nibribacter ruber]QHL88531.1 hypothetical protein GU926_14245 [Nibribacter ruber]
MKKVTQFLVVATAVVGMACSADKQSATGKEGFTPQPMNFGTAATSTDSSGGSVAMNPPHGQMGHRCDIEVGAPLNSAPKATLPITTSTPVQAAPQPVQVTPQPVATAPGMNPPHGQPGHSCSVAVGAPLPK